MRFPDAIRSLLLTWLLLLLAPFVRAQVKPAAPQIVITHVTIINPGTSSVQPHTTVVIDGGRITVLSNAVRLRLPKGARVLDGHGRYLLPGLWDMHVHSAFWRLVPRWTQHHPAALHRQRRHRCA
jgi:imidazolonepropionase-like amidohydrolase